MKPKKLPVDDMMPTTKMIGRVVRRLRLKQSLNQEELALRAGLAKACVHAVESGRRSPKMDTVERLAGALGISVAALTTEAMLES